MATYIQNTGPLSIYVAASAWSTYVSGVMSASLCGTIPNHVVQAVGLTMYDDWTGEWKIRNSWGEEWGEDGFIRFTYG